MQARNSKNAQGIDVSHHQGTIDWTKVAKDGIDFVYIKATQNSIDSMFITNVKGANAAGLLVGAYHYLDKSVTTAVLAQEAAQKFFRAIVKAGGIDVFHLPPPALDYEESSGLTKAQMNVVAKAFLSEIHTLTGMKPIVYTGNSFAANFAGEVGIYPLWIARYSTVVPWNVTAWRSWDIWQYSSGTSGGTRPNGSRSVAGISGNVNLNEYKGTLAELKAAYNKESGGEEVPVTEQDIHGVSAWAAEDWAEAKANGYFDGTRPGAATTREETAIVINRLRNNFLKLIAGYTTQIADLKSRLEAIEKEKQ